jgi:hypothetical protein
MSVYRPPYFFGNANDGYQGVFRRFRKERVDAVGRWVFCGRRGHLHADRHFHPDGGPCHKPPRLAAIPETRRKS